MASISPPTPLNFTFPSTNLLSAKRILYHPSRIPDSASCRCAGSSDNTFPIQARRDSAIQYFLKTLKRFGSYARKDDKDREDENGIVFYAERKEDEEEEDEDWDWDRWKKHFEQIDEQERILSVLKLQLSSAVSEEDFEDAARLKVAIAAAATNDTVGMVMSHLKRAVDEERFRDATLLQDTAGAGLVGWWAGVSEDVKDPYGLIIHITAEHGRYVARRYKPRRLAMTAAKDPLFEIFVTINKKGEYKQQAVYLKKGSMILDPSTVLSRGSGSSSLQRPTGSNDETSDLFNVSTEDAEDGNTDDGSDMTEGLPGFQNVLRDMIPGVKVKGLKVTSTEKVDRDFISKVFEQTNEEEDEDKDDEVEILELDSELEDGSDQEGDDIIPDENIEISGGEIIDEDGNTEISVEIVVDSPLQKHRETLRVPAKLEKKGHFTFSFSVEKEISQQDSNFKEQTSASKAKFQGQLSMDTVMSDIAKHISDEKIPSEVRKKISELVNFTLSEVQNHIQPLAGSTTFHRIEIPTIPDPLNGLYIDSHRLHTEVIHLQRKFGQWQDDGPKKETPDLKFYEYVEAVKLIGDPSVPAGQVVFRAKIGKRYQIPSRGMIAEKLGVIARYKGQGRIAERGFRDPKWVDGELIILDGKLLKGAGLGPLVGFIDPGYSFVRLFDRLNLQP